jgi:integrase
LREAVAKRSESVSSRPLTKEEFDSIIEELKQIDPVLTNAVLIAVHTGLRWGEIAALQWPDINEDDRIIRVKGRDSGRTVSIPDSFIPVLNAMRAENPTSELVIGRRRSFLTGVLNRLLRRVCVALRIPVVSARSLGATFAARAVVPGRVSDPLRKIIDHSK